MHTSASWRKENCLSSSRSPLTVVGCVFTRISPAQNPLAVKILAQVFVDKFFYECLGEAVSITPRMAALLHLHQSGSPTAQRLQRASLEDLYAAKKLSEKQAAVVSLILASTRCVHAVWSIADAGKTHCFTCILAAWRRSRRMDDDDMAWIKVPRQLLRPGLFEAMKELFEDGELMMWRSHDDWDDYLDDYLRDAVDKALAAEMAHLAAIGIEIEVATATCDRSEVFELHGKGYHWLREQYLDKQAQVANTCLPRVKAFILIADLTIKSFARLSPKHKRFL